MGRSGGIDSTAQHRPALEFILTLLCRRIYYPWVASPEATRVFARSVLGAMNKTT